MTTQNSPSAAEMPALLGFANLDAYSSHRGAEGQYPMTATLWQAILDTTATNEREARVLSQDGILFDRDLTLPLVRSAIRIQDYFLGQLEAVYPVAESLREALNLWRKAHAPSVEYACRYEAKDVCASEAYRWKNAWMRREERQTGEELPRDVDSCEIALQYDCGYAPLGFIRLATSRFHPDSPVLQEMQRIVQEEAEEYFRQRPIETSSGNDREAARQYVKPANPSPF